MQNQSRCCLLNLLPILEARGNCCDKIDEALKYYKAALKIEKQFGHQLGQANQLANIGIVYAEQGRRSQALKLLQRAREFYLKIGAKTEGLQIVEEKIKQLAAE